MTKTTGIKTKFIDIPELTETFADSIGSLRFDSQVMKIEFRTTRQDQVEPPNPPNNIQSPVCRLVLTPKASIELYNHLQLIMNQLEKDGVLNKNKPPVNPEPTGTSH